MSSPSNADLPRPVPSGRTALVAGATGLVGGQLLGRLLADPGWERVTVLARRPLPGGPGAASGRPDVRVVDFAGLDSAAAIPADAAFCALGTTIRKAGSQAAFRAVDHDAVVAFARLARRSGVSCFVLVSSVGASPSARNFYLRTKGEAEASVAALEFSRLVIMRPSLLLGPRSEARAGEAIARALVPVVNPLLPRRYRGIDAGAVATAMVAAARASDGGRVVWEYEEIRAAAGMK